MKKKIKKRLNTLGSEVIQNAKENLTLRSEVKSLKKRIRQVLAVAGFIIMFGSYFFDFLAYQFLKTRFLSVSYSPGFGAWQGIGLVLGLVVMVRACWKWEDETKEKQ